MPIDTCMCIVYLSPYQYSWLVEQAIERKQTLSDVINDYLNSAHIAYTND